MFDMHTVHAAASEKVASFAKERAVDAALVVEREPRDRPLDALLRTLRLISV